MPGEPDGSMVTVWYDGFTSFGFSYPVSASRGRVSLSIQKKHLTKESEHFRAMLEDGSSFKVGDPLATRLSKQLTIFTRKQPLASSNYTKMIAQLSMPS
jgi:hypothetical protein